MKGRANYLCLHRLAEYHSRQEVKGRRLAPDDAIFLPIIERWVPETQTGDRAELADLPEDLALWHEVSATAETCLGSDCPRYSECFVTRMRQRAAESDVVIVNHHLLCADAAVRESAYGEVIPSCPHLVVDEAHQLEDVATQYFGVTVSNHRVDDLVRDADATLRGFGRDRAAHDAARGLMRVLDHSRAFFSALALARAGRSGVEDRVRLDAGMVRRSPRHRAGAERRARRPRGDLRPGRGGAPRRRDRPGAGRRGRGVDRPAGRRPGPRAALPHRRRRRRLRVLPRGARAAPWACGPRRSTSRGSCASS